MKYETALKLKRAGFPQKERGTLVFAEGITLADSQEVWNKNSAYVPTTDELIEELGDDFHSLERYENGERWRCVKWIRKLYKCDDGKSRYGCVSECQSWGFTKQEALANLYLEIKKK